MRVIGGVVRNNSAVVAGSGQGLGGGLYAGAAVSLYNTLIDSNWVTASNTGQSGARIQTFCVNTSFIISCLWIIGNAFGGGVFSDAYVNVTGGVFRNNSAVVAGSGQGQGGGINAQEAAYLNDTFFESNSVFANSASQSGARHQVSAYLSREFYLLGLFFFGNRKCTWRRHQQRWLRVCDGRCIPNQQRRCCWLGTSTRWRY